MEIHFDLNAMFQRRAVHVTEFLVELVHLESDQLLGRRDVNAHDGDRRALSLRIAANVTNAFMIAFLDLDLKTF